MKRVAVLCSLTISLILMPGAMPVPGGSGMADVELNPNKKFQAHQQRIQLSRNGDIVVRAVEGPKDVESGGIRKPARGDEVEIRWVGRDENGHVFDRSDDFEALVVGRHLGDRVPTGVESVVKSLMIRGSSFAISLRGKAALLANGTCPNSGAEVCVAGRRLQCPGGTPCTGHPHACAPSVEYEVTLRDIHMRIKLPELPGLVIKTFGRPRMELVPPEIIRMDDGGVAKALVESRLWWPACDENGQEERGAGKRGGGGQLDNLEDEQGSESECSDSSGDGQDSELFVIGEELPGRSEVVGSMRERTFTMGGSYLPPAVFEALKHTAVNQRVFVVLRHNLISNVPPGLAGKYRDEVEALKNALDQVEPGQPKPVLVYEIFISEFMPWQWMQPKTRLEKARDLLACGDSLYASNDVENALERYRSANEILECMARKRKPDRMAFFEQEEVGGESFGASNEDEVERERLLELMGRTFMGRANAHRVLGRVDKAAQLSKHAMRLLPADPSAWLCGALAHQSKGDTKTAMRLATAILSKNPTARLASVAETLIKSLRAKLNSAKTFQAQAQAQAQSFLPL